MVMPGGQLVTILQRMVSPFAQTDGAERILLPAAHAAVTPSVLTKDLLSMDPYPP